MANQVQQNQAAEFAVPGGGLGPRSDQQHKEVPITHVEQRVGDHYRSIDLTAIRTTLRHRQ